MLPFLLAAALILPTHTPGARYSVVTQANIQTTICKRGWTRTIRPPASYTSKLKREQLAAWNYADQNPADYQEDHLVSLELGGSPRSHRNLWPEPWPQARRDDRSIENPLRASVCAGLISLRYGQELEIAYKHVFG